MEGKYNNEDRISYVLQYSFELVSNYVDLNAYMGWHGC